MHSDLAIGHTCPGRCGDHGVPTGDFACGSCWSRLPAALRAEVRAAYAGRAQDPTTHRTALVQAMQWYRQNPSTTPNGAA